MSMRHFILDCRFYPRSLIFSICSAFRIQPLLPSYSNIMRMIVNWPFVQLQSSLEDFLHVLLYAPQTCPYLRALGSR